MHKNVFILFFWFCLISIFALAACDLINADKQLTEPIFMLCDEPGNASLTDTTWVSLPGQRVSGKKPEYRPLYDEGFTPKNLDVTYTLRITSDSLNHHFLLTGISISNHEHPEHGQIIGSGNHYVTYWDINDENKPALPMSNLGVRMTQMGVPHTENWSFVNALDYKVQGNCLSILYGGKDKQFVLEFGLFSDEHELSEWYYNRYGRQ